MVVRVNIKACCRVRTETNSERPIGIPKWNTSELLSAAVCARGKLQLVFVCWVKCETERTVDLADDTFRSTRFCGGSPRLEEEVLRFEVFLFVAGVEELVSIAKIKTQACCDRLPPSVTTSFNEDLLAAPTHHAFCARVSDQVWCTCVPTDAYCFVGTRANCK